MKQQQSFVTFHHKNGHFGEPCESGYSTTTSSEEGTLQRGVTHARKQGFANESFLQNPKLLKMVSKGINDEEGRSENVTSKPHKKRAKNVYHDSPGSPSSQGSPYSSTSSLTQQNAPQYEDGDFSINGRHARNPHKHSAMMSSDDAISRSHGNLADRSSTDEMTSSFEDLDVRDKQNYGVTNDDVIKPAAIQQFQQSMNQVKSNQTEKFSYPHIPKGNPQFDVDYYRVGDDTRNPYYDPLDISDVIYGQSKKRVVISTSPSNSSSGGSPVKQPSPMRGILKNSNHGYPQNYTSSTPTRKNSLQTIQQFSKSEENLTSIKNITPPNLPSPLRPGNRKSAFVIVKPRAINRSAFPEGPVMPVHPPVQQMIMQNGFESHHGRRGSSHSCCHGLNDQAIQFQVTIPRNSTQIPRPTTLEYTTIVDQLLSPQDERPPIMNGSQLTPRDGNIVFIPAQIDENGIARPVVSGFHGNVNFHDNGGRHHGNQQRENQKPRPVNHDKVRPRDDCSQSHSNGHNHSNVHSNSSHDNNRKSESPLPPAEALSNEAVRLRQLLENARPEELKQRLEKLLKSKDPSSIHAMTKLFPGSEFTADAAHCVRCHKDFNPREPGRCMLPHPERMVAKISQDSIGADFVCGCCKAGFRLIQMDFYEESTNALLTGHCYSGTHTTDPDSVDYRIDGGVAKSCEEFGCVEFYV